MLHFILHFHVVGYLLQIFFLRFQGGSAQEKKVKTWREPTSLTKFSAVVRL